MKSPHDYLCSLLSLDTFAGPGMRMNREIGIVSLTHANNKSITADPIGLWQTRRKSATSRNRIQGVRRRSVRNPINI